MTNFPMNPKPVLLYSGAANAVDCDVISTKYAHKVWFIVHHDGANDTDLTLSLYESDNVAKNDTAAVTTACPFWLDSDVGTSSDTLVKQTDAYEFTIDPATQADVLAVLEVDPAILSDGYPCVFLSDADGHGSNTCEIYALVEMRNTQETPPSVLTD